jgi:HK97 family phage prohead protease
LPAGDLGDYVANLIARGDVYGSSFGFRNAKDRWERKDGKALRTLVEMDVFDVGPVVNPAYEDTSVAVRGYEAFITDEIPYDNRNLAIRVRS